MNAKPPVIHVINELITHPERYVTASGTYADGYLDALLDVLTGLGLLHPGASYQQLREQIAGKRGTAS